MVAPGVSDFQFAFWDAIPTFAELAQGSAPSDIDGVSIVPTLMGKSQPQREYGFWTWDGTGVNVESTGKPKVPGYGVRMNDWKGVVAHCASQEKPPRPSFDDTMELYNLSHDPFETTDVAHKNPKVVEELKKLVQSKNLTCTCFQC